VDGVRCDAAEQAACLVALPSPGDEARRLQGHCTESDQAQRMIGDVEDRSHDVVGERCETRRQPGERSPPGGTVGAEPGGRVGERAHHDRGTAAVERVGEVDGSVAPGQPVLGQWQRREKR
jgi:hypothetical protein